MPIPSRTAILIIHGIGEQNPFETLDQYARGFYNLYGRKFKDEQFTLEHKLLKQENNKGDKWIDSFVRLQAVGTKFRDTQYLDVHEYYWANLTEEQVSVGEISDWLKDALKGADITFSKMADPSVKAESKSLKDLKKMVRRVMFWYRVVKAAFSFFMAFASIWHVIMNFFDPYSNVLKRMRDWFDTWATKIIRDYLGDVTIYTTMDVKKKHYELRCKILEGARVQLQTLLQGDYDRVLVCGHSLGTVIAYDALNKISIQASLDGEEKLAENSKKLIGLVTFGSPLDKTFFFFSQHAEKEQYVRRQLMSHLHSFKVKKDLYPAEKPVLTDPVKHSLDKLPWLNFYSVKDPVSSRLSYFYLNDNIPCTFKPEYEKWGIAHLGYWDHDPMYDRIFSDFLEIRS
jgi:hypothetical protein